MYDKYVGLQFNTFNCYGLIQHIFKDKYNIEIPSLSPKSDQSKKVYLIYLQQVSDHWASVDTLQEGDVIAMAYLPKHPDVVQHFGIYIGNNKLIHTLDKINAHIVPIDHPTVKNTIRGYYRWQH